MSLGRFLPHGLQDGFQPALTVPAKLEVVLPAWQVRLDLCCNVPSQGFQADEGTLKSM